MTRDISIKELLSILQKNYTVFVDASIFSDDNLYVEIKKGKLISQLKSFISADEETGEDTMVGIAVVERKKRIYVTRPSF